MFHEILNSILMALLLIQLFIVVKSILSLWTIYSDQGLNKPLIQISLFLLTGSFFTIFWSFLDTCNTTIAELPCYFKSPCIRLALMGYVIESLGALMITHSLARRSSKVLKKWHFFIKTLGFILILFFLLITPFSSLTIPHYIVLFVLPFYSITIFLTLLAQLITTHFQTEQNLILQKQIKVFIALWLVRYLSWNFICDLYSLFSFFTPSLSWHIPKLSLLISEFLFTSSIYFGIKKLINLRFLNIKKRVDSQKKINLQVLYRITKKLQSADSLQDIEEITQQFFKSSLNIPSHRLCITIFNQKKENPEPPSISPNILIKDEIEYNLLYEESKCSTNDLKTLEKNQASIFIPIHHKDTLIASLAIHKKALGKRLLTSSEQEAIHFFSTTLATAITAIHSNHVVQQLEKSEKEKKHLVHHNQKMKQEVLQKKYHDDLYKETIASLIKNKEEQSFSIFELRGKTFHFLNEKSKELLGVNPNKHKSHPTTQALYRIASDALHTKTSQSVTILHANERDTIAQALPLINKKHVMFLIYQPTLSKETLEQIKTLTNPSEWEHVLYLETTEIGRMITRFIPGSQPSFLRYKTKLLQAILHKKPILLIGTTHDIPKTIEIISQKNIHKKTTTLTLHEPEKNDSYGLNLFGVSELFLANTHDDAAQNQALLKKHEGIGTIIIKNIENLSPESQKNLATYLKTGFFTPLKSSKKTNCSTPVICTSTTTSITQNALSPELQNELTVVTMPNLKKINPEEIISLAETIAAHYCLDEKLPTIFTLSKEEKNDILLKELTSVTELRACVKSIINQKTKETSINPAEIASHKSKEHLNLSYAAALGKEALKDREIMNFLWKKFEKKHAKIATFLGVHRSSVHRRCESYKFK